MSARTITVEHDGETYYAVVATIKSTHLGPEDHGIFTAMFHLEGDGWGVGAGGLFLGGAFAIEHIKAVMHAVGVDTWEQLAGRQVLALRESKAGWGGRNVGIAHISDESRVLIFAKHAEQWRAENNTQEVRCG